MSEGRRDGRETGPTSEQDRKLRARAHEIGRRERQLLNIIASLVVVLVGVCVAKYVEKQRTIVQLQNSVAEKERIITQLQNSVVEKQRIITRLQRFSSAAYTCHVSGPGLSASANHPTHVIVELSDASGQPCSLRQNVTAELQSVDQSSAVPTTVFTRSPSQYEVFYTALSRGQHKLIVRLNNSEVSGNVTVYPDPTQLRTPVEVVIGLKSPDSIAISSHGEMVVSSFLGHTVFLLDKEGKKIQTYGSKGDRPDQMRYPKGVAVDNDDNVYVASEHKLQKFSRDGHLIKCVGQYGSKDGEFNCPTGVKIHHGYVYVCDQYNDRIQVFDTDLNFIRTFGSLGSGMGHFNEPYDLDFDSEGKAYIADGHNDRIQVVDKSGQFVRQLGQEEGEGNLKWPTAVHVVGQFVYVSNEGHGCISVYQTSGQFVTSFGEYGEGERELIGPYGITSDQNGFVYVTDFNNNRVEVY